MSESDVRALFGRGLLPQTIESAYDEGMPKHDYELDEIKYWLAENLMPWVDNRVDEARRRIKALIDDDLREERRAGHFHALWPNEELQKVVNWADFDPGFCALLIKQLAPIIAKDAQLVSLLNKQLMAVKHAALPVDKDLQDKVNSRYLFQALWYFYKGLSSGLTHQEAREMAAYELKHFNNGVPKTDESFKNDLSKARRKIKESELEFYLTPQEMELFRQSSRKKRND